MPARRLVHQTLHGLERRLDRRSTDRRDGEVIISPYRGFGREGELRVSGRVLFRKAITTASGSEPLWRSVLNTYRRFHSDEVAGARVRAVFRGVAAEEVSDEEGHFTVLLSTAAGGDGSRWRAVDVDLPERGVSAVCHVLVPPPDCDFGVISDIDDTVVVTNATSLLGMARSVIRNAASRLPFEGVAELYRAFHRDRNPLFYVSSSPWNLYELLHDFMDLNAIPHGPMLLQDWGVDENTFILASHEEHKLEQIRLLLDYYPHLPFVLIGDSGQHDPEIYLRVIQSYPGRIRAAFIRDVAHDLRDRTVAAIIEQSNTAGVEMLHVRDSAEAMEHARRLHLI